MIHEWTSLISPPLLPFAPQLDLCPLCPVHGEPYIRVKYDTTECHKFHQDFPYKYWKCKTSNIWTCSMNTLFNPLSPSGSGVLGSVGLGTCPQFVPQQHCVSANNYNIIIQFGYHYLVGAQPPPCCPLARYLLGKMAIHCSFAHR